jgi:hypothetical protein
MMLFPEQYRLTWARLVPSRRDDPAIRRWCTDPGDRHGVFFVPSGRRRLKVLASDAQGGPDEGFTVTEGWEHVSVSVADRGGPTGAVLPTWTEMEMVRGLFWDPESTVIQVHPPRSTYVNVAEVLHLWRPTTQPIPLPPVWLV